MSCSASTGPGASAPACDEVVLTGEAGGPADVVRARRRPAGRRPRRQVARRGAAEARPRHAARGLPARAGAPRLPVPRARARSAAWRATSRTPSRATPCSPRALADWQREQLAERELQGLMDDIELPLVGILRDMERAGVRLDVERLAEITERVRGRSGRSRRRSGTLAGDGVRPRLAAAARRDPVREARAVAQAARQDRLLHRRARAAGDPRRARDHPQDRALARAQPARQDLLRRPAAARRTPRVRIHTTFLQAVAITGPAREHEPEHAERPDPHGARPGDPRLLRGGARQRPAQRRLLADRAARARAHRRRAGAQGDLRQGRGRAHRDRVAGLRARRPTSSTPGMRSKAKMINYGIVYGLSDYGLADRLGIPREEAKAFIDAYLDRFPAVRAFIEAMIAQATRGRLRARRSGAAGARSRSSRRATGRCARSASASRSTARSRAPPPTSSSSRWSAATRRCADAGLATRMILTSTTSCSSRGRRRRSRRSRELVAARWSRVWDHEPAARRRRRGREDLARRQMTRSQRITLLAAISGTFVVGVDSTVVNVALPSIEDDLGGGLAGQQWVVNAYLLMLGSLILVGGSLGDLFGERRVFMVGVGGFGAVSILCAVAPTIGALSPAGRCRASFGALLTPGRSRSSWRRSRATSGAPRSARGRRGAGSRSSSARSSAGGWSTRCRGGRSSRSTCPSCSSRWRSRRRIAGRAHVAAGRARRRRRRGPVRARAGGPGPSRSSSSRVRGWGDPLRLRRRGRRRRAARRLRALGGARAAPDAAARAVPRAQLRGRQPRRRSRCTPGSGVRVLPARLFLQQVAGYDALEAGLATVPTDARDVPARRGASARSPTATGRAASWASGRSSRRPACCC